MNRTFQWDNITGDGREHFDSRDPSIEIVVDDPVYQGNAGAAAQIKTVESGFDVSYHRISIGPDFVALDIFAHEYAHLLVDNSVPLGFEGEPRTISEHYADVMSLGMFPDPTFRIGEDLTNYYTDPNGPRYVRNVLNPNDPLAEGSNSIIHMNRRRDCDPRTDYKCSYTWIGIPNKVFGLVSTGNQNWAGLGIEMSAKFWFELVRDPQASWQLEAFDNLANLGLKLRSACLALEAEQPEAAGARQRVGAVSMLTCTEIERALDSVGMLNRITGAFSRYVHESTTNQTFTVNAGKRLYNGCRILGHTLKLEYPTTERIVTLMSDLNDAPPFTFNIAGGQIFAEIIARCGGHPSTCVDDQNLETSMFVNTKYAGGVVVYPEISLYVPSGVPESACYHANPQSKFLYYWSTPITHIRSFLMFGDRQDHQIEPNTQNGSFQNGHCQLTAIGGVDEHARAYPKADTMQREFSHGVHGFRVTRLNPTNNFDYSAKLHVWVDGFQFMFARVVYELEQNPGKNCDFPGIVLIPERHIQ